MEDSLLNALIGPVKRKPPATRAQPVRQQPEGHQPEGHQPEGHQQPKREPPPLSLTVRWDKVKWHADGDGLPPGVTGIAAGRHVFAALDFLGVEGQLTAEGLREQAGDLAESTALLRAHVKAGARSFLDATYTQYLEAMNYGEEPPTEILERAWQAWMQRYDVSKRPVANAYQALLLKHSPGNDLEGLLGKLEHEPALAEPLREALPCVPEAESGLAQAVLSVLTDGPLKAAKAVKAAKAGDYELVARALRYSQDALGRLKAALYLEPKLASDVEALESLAWAVNLHDAAVADAARAQLTPRQRATLRDLVHRLFLEEAEAPHESGRKYPYRMIATCALRAHGDASSVALLKQHPPRDDEGSVSRPNARGKWETEPMSADVRREVARRVAARGG